MLKQQLSRHGRGGGSSLGSDSGVVLHSGIDCLCAGARQHVSRVGITTTSGTSMISGHRHKGASRGMRHKR